MISLLIMACAGCEEADARREEPEVEPPARADEFRSAAVDETLDAAAEVVRTRGFNRAGDDWRGFVVRRETEVQELPMKTGTCYVVVAVGSPALRELGLRIFDGDGGEVARDRRGGGRAALHYCPPQSGTHYVGVRASSGNGLFAVRHFRGPTGLDVRLDDLFPSPKPTVEAERP